MIAEEIRLIDLRGYERGICIPVIVVQPAAQQEGTCAFQLYLVLIEGRQCGFAALALLCLWRQ